jgi:parvulin-like peptidyl-prolyl isomerase
LNEQLECGPTAVGLMAEDRRAGLGVVGRARHRMVARSLFALTLLAGAFSPSIASDSADKKNVVARVGDTSIGREEFDLALANAARRKFYHGKTPDGEMAALQREVAGNMVDNVLLLKEAKRLGLKPDAEPIKKTLSEYEARYKSSEQWQSKRAVLLPKLQKQLETDSLLQQLQTRVQSVGQPDAAQLQSYYAANLDKFTEPERSRVSTILLKVDPSSPRPVWDKTQTEATSLVKKLRAGTNFAQLARQRSGDESATKGGDMGYLHRGMLAEPAQIVVDKLKPNEISEPVRLLQGVAIFRLDERKAAVQNPLSKVEQRARELWQREQGERAWQGLLTALRKATPSAIDESTFLPVASIAGVAGMQPKAK